MSAKQEHTKLNVMAHAFPHTLANYLAVKFLGQSQPWHYHKDIFPLFKKKSLNGNEGSSYFVNLLVRNGYALKQQFLP